MSNITDNGTYGDDDHLHNDNNYYNYGCLLSLGQHCCYIILYIVIIIISIITVAIEADVILTSLSM